MANDFGDLWSISRFGFGWLAQASKRPFLDMSRMSEVLAGFVPHFGLGFGQRAVEAVRTYRTANYLAACSMAGAAAESILLAAAIAKSKNEGKILKMYEFRRRAGPRHDIFDGTGNEFGQAAIRVDAPYSPLLAR